MPGIVDVVDDKEEELELVVLVDEVEVEDVMVEELDEEELDEEVRVVEVLLVEVAVEEELLEVALLLLDVVEDVTVIVDCKETALCMVCFGQCNWQHPDSTLSKAFAHSTELAAVPRDYNGQCGQGERQFDRCEVDTQHKSALEKPEKHDFSLDSVLVAVVVLVLAVVEEVEDAVSARRDVLHRKGHRL